MCFKAVPYRVAGSKNGPGMTKKTRTDGERIERFRPARASFSWEGWNGPSPNTVQSARLCRGGAIGPHGVKICAKSSCASWRRWSPALPPPSCLSAGCLSPELMRCLYNTRRLKLLVKLSMFLTLVALKHCSRFVSPPLQNLVQVRSVHVGLRISRPRRRSGDHSGGSRSYTREECEGDPASDMHNYTRRRDCHVEHFAFLCHYRSLLHINTISYTFSTC